MEVGSSSRSWSGVGKIKCIPINPTQTAVRRNCGITAARSAGDRNRSLLEKCFLDIHLNRVLLWAGVTCPGTGAHPWGACPRWKWKAENLCGHHSWGAPKTLSRMWWRTFQWCDCGEGVLAAPSLKEKAAGLWSEGCCVLELLHQDAPAHRPSAHGRAPAHSTAPWPAGSGCLSAWLLPAVAVLPQVTSRYRAVFSTRSCSKVMFHIMGCWSDSCDLAFRTVDRNFAVLWIKAAFFVAPETLCSAPKSSVLILQL